MAHRTLALIFCLAVAAATVAQTPTPPTSGITPIKNGKLITQLDANNLPIVNLDITGSGLGGGGGGSGLNSITGDDGSAIGVTLAISHITGSNLTDPIFTLGGTLTAAHGGTGVASLSLLKTALSLNNVDNTSDASKPISTATQTALNLKLEAADLAAYAGTSNLVTLGTIATGVWHGTPLGAAYVPALNDITAPTGTVNLNSNKVTNSADPTGATDLTNKQYVDAVATGGVPHSAAATASTNNRTLSGEQTIDGVLTSTSRVLLKNQTAPAENGIYVTAAGAWARAADADTGAEVAGSVFVSGGTINAGTTWAVTTPQPITINTDPVAYTQTGANTIYSAANGITLAGSQFSLTTMPTGTLKGNNTGGTAVPTDLTYATVKSAMSLNSVENTALSTWAGSTNITTLGTIATGVIPPARIQGITTVGTNFLNSLGTPGNNSFVRINATTGTLTERTFGETLSDIGGQTVITASAPLALTVGGALSIPAATDSVAGYLTSSDHTTFAAKVPPGRTLTATAPLRISTSTTPLSGAPGSDLSANRTFDITLSTNSVDGYLSATDHTTFAAKAPPDSIVTFNGGTTGAPVTWTAGATVANETGALTVTRYALLPAANAYQPGKKLTYYDDKTTTGAFGRQFRPAGSTDTLQGSNAAAYGVNGLAPFIGGGSSAAPKTCTFETDGVSAWVMLGAGAIDHIEDSARPTTQGTFDLSGVTGGTTVPMTWPNSAFTGVVPNGGGAAPAFVTGVGPTGNLVTASVDYSDLTGVPGGPDASFTTLTPGAVVTLACDAAKGDQNARVVLNSSAALVVSGVFDGAHGELRVVQGGSGSYSLSLPLGSGTAPAGAGVATLSTAVGSIDKLRWSYGTDEGYLWEVVGLNYTAASCATSAHAYQTGGPNVSPVGNNSGTIGLAAKYVPNSSYTSCKVTLDLDKVEATSVTGNLTVSIYADDGVTSGGKPTGTALATSSVVAASSLSTSISTITFPNLSFAFTSGVTYWIQLQTTATPSGTNFVNWGYASSASNNYYKTNNTLTNWVSQGNAAKFRMSWYK